jgi:hypothetical protein
VKWSSVRSGAPAAAESEAANGIVAVEVGGRNEEAASDRSEVAAIAEIADLVASVAVRLLEVAVVRSAGVVPIGIDRVSHDPNRASSRARSERRKLADGAKSRRWPMTRGAMTPREVRDRAVGAAVAADGTATIAGAKALRAPRTDLRPSRRMGTATTSHIRATDP